MSRVITDRHAYYDSMKCYLLLMSMLGEMEAGPSMSWRASKAVCTYAACSTATVRIAWEELGLNPIFPLGSTGCKYFIVINL